MRCGEYQREAGNLCPLVQPAIVMNNLGIHGLSPRLVDAGVYCIEYAADKEWAPGDVCAGLSEDGLNIVKGEISPGRGKVVEEFDVGHGSIPSGLHNGSKREAVVSLPDLQELLYALSPHRCLRVNVVREITELAPQEARRRLARRFVSLFCVLGHKWPNGALMEEECRAIQCNRGKGLEEI